MKNFDLWMSISGSLLIAAPIQAQKKAKEKQPNVIFIIADDLGYGDMSCYGAHRVQTPHVDALASSDAGMVIRPEQTTIADMFKSAGYTTGAIGKWHLGLGDKTGTQDWNKKVSPGPEDLGFDYSCLMAATGDRVPCVWMENQQVLNYDPSAPIEVSYTKPFPGEPTGKNNPELLTNLKPSPNHGHNQAIVNGISRIGYMKGGGKALWKDEDIADTIIAKTVGFIERNSDKPFFLYVGTNDVHVPRFPHPRFVGKSGMGYRGDAILQFDYTVGKILEALEKQGLRENTLIVLSSDNGPVVDDGYQDQAVELLGDHRPWGNLRGGKYSNFEAGTRVPFIVSWPDKVKKGKTSDALVSQIDLFASMAELVGQEMQSGAGVDSQNQLKAFLGTDPGNAPVDQLYNLKKDRGEKENLAEKYPEKVKAMKAILEREKANTK